MSLLYPNGQKYYEYDFGEEPKDPADEQSLYYYSHNGNADQCEIEEEMRWLGLLDDPVAKRFGITRFVSTSAGRGRQRRYERDIVLVYDFYNRNYIELSDDAYYPWEGLAEEVLGETVPKDLHYPVFMERLLSLPTWWHPRMAWDNKEKFYAIIDQKKTENVTF